MLGTFYEVRQQRSLLEDTSWDTPALRHEASRAGVALVVDGCDDAAAILSENKFKVIFAGRGGAGLGAFLAACAKIPIEASIGHMVVVRHLQGDFHSAACWCLPLRSRICDEGRRERPSWREV